MIESGKYMLSNLRIIFIISFLLFISVAVTGFGQNKPSASEILVKIEQGFQTGDENKISEFIDSKTYFSFTADLSGYYSYSQIINLLRDYFEAYKPLKFRFTSKSTNASSPFAWGNYVFLKRGIRGTHKIFVSLQKNGSSYHISQISINE